MRQLSPLTGYPPWTRLSGSGFSVSSRTGDSTTSAFTRGVRPEAAFEAADELGFYFQAELPNKRSAFKAPESTDAQKRNIDYIEIPGADPSASLYDYAIREADLIFQHFGNHPSFVMFTLGNELGRNPAMFELVAHFQKSDPRHLYAQGSSSSHWAPSYAEGNDFWVTSKTAKDKPVRGAYYHGDFLSGGHIYSRPPSTLLRLL
ncbi:MAG: glycoside hydrolase family 2 TIM barrel-domain containing protein [Gemmatimonadaceae bacterium]|nr:glycoside hydrolase family 2 TIM barrel-domain containing protein [Gemmatimonadaceae bacterium]